MANYAISNTTAIGGGTPQVNIGTSYKGMVVVANTTTPGGTQAGGVAAYMRRGKLYDILVGTINTPADAYVEWSVTRCAAGGLSTGSVSCISSLLGLDAGDIGFQYWACINTSLDSFHTWSATPNVELWYVGVNQRASYRWVAAPGSEFVWAANTSATAPNGLALRSRGSATIPGTGTLYFQEQ